MNLSQIALNILEVLKLLKYIEGNYEITDFENGTKIKTIISESIQQPEEIPTISLEEQIKDIKNTVDLLLLKQEGII